MTKTFSQHVMQLETAQITNHSLDMQIKVFGPRELETVERILADNCTDKKIRVVDLGCGSGGFTFLFANRFLGAEILGLDVNKHLLDVGRPYQHPRIKYVRCDIESEDLKKYIREADIIFSRYTFQHLRDYKQLLKNLARNMKSKARLIVLESIHSEHREDIEGGLFNELINALEAMMDRMGSDNKMSVGLAEDFKQVGLKSAEQIKIKHELCFCNQKDFIDLLRSYCAVIAKFYPDLIRSPLANEIEKYIINNPRAKIYFTTSATHGISK